MKYAYYSGCSLHSTAKEYDMSTRAIAQPLGIELEEIPGWNCCGATSAHATSELLALALPARNLLAAQGLGLDVLVSCAACYSRFKTTNKAMNGNHGNRDKVAEILGHPYDGQVRVRHLLEVLTADGALETLKSQVAKPLTDLRVACYYGCLLVRPPEVADFDDPENPTSLDDLATALGAEPVRWPCKTECCGGSLSLTRTDVVLKLARDLLEAATDNAADCIIVACPLCQSNLDLRQAQVNKQYKTAFSLPILYFTQLVGLALGIEGGQLGLNKLLVSPDKMLRAKVTVDAGLRA